MPEELTKVIVGRDATDAAKYGSTGTMYIGRHLVGAGEEAHLTTPVLLDALRPHIILICGKRGEGKCLSHDTKVILPDGSEKPIRDIFKDVVPEPDWTKDEILTECPEGIKPLVLTLDSNLNIGPAQASHVYRKKVKEKLIRITTKRGREIECTKEHPLLSIEDNLTWRMASELKAASPIATSQTSVQSSQGVLLKSFIMSWDDIEKIEEVDYEGFVYDLTVPGTHNFLAGSGGGIVCHNSYSMGIIAEEMQKLQENVRKNLSSLIIDTQGIFWTMKRPNEKDISLLTEWGMKPESFDALVYVPEGQQAIFTKAGVIFDGVFSVSPDELDAEDWLSVFELDPNQPLGILVQRAVGKLKERAEPYGLKEIIESIKAQPGFESEKLALENRFEAARAWGIFGTAKMPPILEPGRLTIVDISLTPMHVRALMIALMCRKLFEDRTLARRKEELAEAEGATIRRTPMCWIMIDEAHNFVPAEGKPASLEILLKISREGRQPGLTLVLASQRPEMLHPDALAQTDLILSHRLTAKADIDSLRAIMQTYMLYDIAKYISDLPKLKGVALILDDSSERLYTIRMRPRHSWHAGASPVAI